MSTTRQTNSPCATANIEQCSFRVNCTPIPYCRVQNFRCRSIYLEKCCSAAYSKSKCNFKRTVDGHTSNQGGLHEYMDLFQEEVEMGSLEEQHSKVPQTPAKGQRSVAILTIRSNLKRHCKNLLQHTLLRTVQVYSSLVATPPRSN
jgi:hypothetical protein